MLQAACRQAPLELGDLARTRQMEEVGSHLYTGG
jgi:hypothetical protein